MEDFEEGLPQLAALLDSNESFCILRRFGNPVVRALLRRQTELAQLDAKLRQLDEADAADDAKKQRLQTSEYNTERNELLDKIEAKALPYCKGLPIWVTEESPSNNCRRPTFKIL